MPLIVLQYGNFLKNNSQIAYSECKSALQVIRHDFSNHLSVILSDSSLDDFDKI